MFTDEIMESFFIPSVYCIGYAIFFVFVPTFISSLLDKISVLINETKHASRVSLVIAAVAKASCKHRLWLVARVKKRP